MVRRAFLALSALSVAWVKCFAPSRPDYLPVEDLRLRDVRDIFGFPDRPDGKTVYYGVVEYEYMDGYPATQEFVRVNNGGIAAVAEGALLEKSETWWDDWHRPGFLRIVRTGEESHWIPIRAIRARQL